MPAKNASNSEENCSLTFTEEPHMVARFHGNCSKADEARLRAKLDAPTIVWGE